MNKKIIVLIFPAIFISGCGGDGFGMKESPLWHITASDESKDQYFRQVCLDYGYRANTPELNKCIRSERRGSSSNAGSRMQNWSNQYNSRWNNDTSFSCSRLGNTYNCNSF